MAEDQGNPAGDLADPRRTRSVADVPVSALGRMPISIVLTDPNLDDNPIVYVNDAFEHLTGYSRAHSIGLNCRFLQGEETDPAAIATLREAIENDSDVTVDLLNYRADGSSFMNRLVIAPLTSESGETVFFMGIQVALDEGVMTKSDIDTALREIQHRVKNHLAMVVSMIRVQAQGQGADEVFGALARRVETLQLLYEELEGRGPGQANDDRVSLGAYLTRIASAIGHLDGRSGVRVNVDADEIVVSMPTAVRLGLLVSEIMTNAMKHAFEGRSEGLVELRAKMLSGDVLRVDVSDDGRGMPPGTTWPQEGGLGARIARGLISGLQARLKVENELSGTRVSLDVDLGETGALGAIE